MLRFKPTYDMNLISATLRTAIQNRTVEKLARTAIDEMAGNTANMQKGQEIQK